MFQQVRDRRMCLFVVAAVVTGVWWLQKDLLAERPSAETEVTAISGSVADCPDCQQGRVAIPHTGNPVIDQAYFDDFLEMRRELRRRRMEEIERQLCEKQKIWQGTTAELSFHPQVTDAQRKSAAPFIELFQKDLPAPQVRREQFALFLKPDSPDRCVGWRLRLRSAKKVDDGWLVNVEAHANLLGGGLVISMDTTNETWHVSNEGELTFVEGSPEGDRPARVSARY